MGEEELETDIGKNSEVGERKIQSMSDKWTHEQINSMKEDDEFLAGQEAMQMLLTYKAYSACNL